MSNDQRISLLSVYTRSLYACDACVRLPSLMTYHQSPRTFHSAKLTHAVLWSCRKQTRGSEALEQSRPSLFGCGSKKGIQSSLLVKGKINQNLWRTALGLASCWPQSPFLPLPDFCCVASNLQLLECANCSMSQRRRPRRFGVHSSSIFMGSSVDFCRDARGKAWWFFTCKMVP